MKRITLLMSAFALASTLGGSAAAQDKSIAGQLENVLARFDEAEGGMCGMVLVAAKGKVLLEKGYGWADAEAKKRMSPMSMWDWASVSKQFTAAALLKLQDQKRLRIDDPISKHFRGVPGDKQGVTIRHLLNHTSGIEAGFSNEWKFDARSRESLEELVLKLPMVATPGEKWEYSNSSYALAGAIVERVTGDTFEKYCIEQLFRPSGMKEATFIGQSGLDLTRVPKVDRGAGFTDRPKEFAFAYGNEMTWGYRACGGAVMTAHEMFLWDRALRGNKLLSPAAKAELYTVGLNNYALGWTVKKELGDTMAEHSGAVQGVITQVLRLLEKDVVVAIALSHRPKEHPLRLATELAQIALRAK